MSTLRVTVLIVALAAPGVATQEAILEFHGSDSSGQLGRCVDGGADIDGDGHDDLLLSAWGEGQQSTGAVHLYSGADGHELHAWHGEALNDLFGISAAFAGDVDADGVTDIIVAARVPIVTPLSYAKVFSGADGHTLHTLWADASNGFATYEAVDGIGDVNGDGHDDIVLALDHNGFANQKTDIEVRSGQDGSLLFVIDEAGDASHPVRVAGDLNGDGVPDIVYGDQYHALQVGSANHFVGAVRTFSGLDGTLLHESVGDGRNDHFGIAVDGISDLDGDGHADVLGGATQWLGLDFPGYVRLESGMDGSLIHEWKGHIHGEDMGSAVSRAGDVDGDGHEDILIGDDSRHFGTPGDGSVRVVSGRDLSLLFEFFGHTGPFNASPSCFLGGALGPAGDVDADGRCDVLIPAPNDSTVASTAGSAWVFSGREFAWHAAPSAPLPKPPTPVLSAFGALDPGGTVALLLTDALPFQPCWIVVGTSQALSPFLGGILVPSPDVVAGPLSLNSTGAFLLSAPVPPALPAGLTICIQAWSASSAAPSGFIGSNAIEATVAGV